MSEHLNLGRRQILRDVISPACWASFLNSLFVGLVVEEEGQVRWLDRGGGL